eukprot:4394609-Amphidinium_carterae.1
MSRTWSILCSTAHTGTRKGGKLACLSMLRWPQLACACMVCSRPLGLDSCRLMSLRSYQNWALPPSGRMARASTAATHTFVDVALATSLTRARDAGWRYLAYDNPSLELNS